MSPRVRDAIGVTLISLSNLLPYRLFRRPRQFILQLAGVKFGGRNFILGPIWIGYPSKLSVGSGCSINGHCFFENIGGVTIGDNVGVGPGTMFLTMNHRGMHPYVDEPAMVTIGDGALLGGGVRLLPGVQIGQNATIGAGSVVTRNVKPGEAVFGNPARSIVKNPVST